ncbi:hypothetical protein HIM_00410 [Hirsutella minnesotensis 3608]|nr:hypothetical protein HIM_00410 [Hirsutella minnesotensis 3608]
MSPSPSPERVAKVMLSWIGLKLISCVETQTLWAGYGHICAIEAQRASEQPVSPAPVRLVLKLIAPPRSNDGDEGHIRKMLSYQVEQYFYDELAPLLDPEVAVAQCLASTRSSPDKAAAAGLHGLTATLMTDLRLEFPVAGHKRSFLASKQVEAALKWLAGFHRSSKDWLPRNLDGLVLPPLLEARKGQPGPETRGHGLWLNGGYTYLATRRTEYANLVADDDSEWSAAFCYPLAGSSTSLTIAEMAADFLTPTGRPFETCIHGDVKSENLFCTASGDRVAFFDFQYAGVGLGVCDLAKLFTCSVPLGMLTDLRAVPPVLPMGQGEENLLRLYLTTLLDPETGKAVLTYDWTDFCRHWETALVDWCRFQASWGFWGNTEWLQSRVRWILGDRGWRGWIQQQVQTATNGTT